MGEGGEGERERRGIGGSWVKGGATWGVEWVRAVRQADTPARAGVQARTRGRLYSVVGWSVGLGAGAL